MIPNTQVFTSGRRNTKRSHSKSRNGCSACKSRRVKCDETHPKCSNCKRRGEECQYIAPGPIFKKRRAVSKQQPPVSEIVNSQSISQADVYRSYISPVTDSSTDSMSIMSNNDIPNEGLSSGNPLIDPELISFNNNLSYVPQEQEIESPEETNLTLKSTFCAYNTLPKYMCYTVLNAKLFSYYQTTYYKRISNDPQVLTAWSALAGVSCIYPYVYHITMSVTLAALYYDAIELKEAKGSEPVLALESPLDYKHLADLHYQQFLRKFDILGVSQSKDMMELFTYMSSSTLHMLYHVLSPNTTICDPFFFQISKTASLMYKELLPFIDDSECGATTDELDPLAEDEVSGSFETTYHGKIKKSVIIRNSEKCLDLNYYSSHSTPVLSQSAWLFFPRYLYQIYEKQPFEEEEDYKSQNVDHDLYKNSIDILRREYNLVYNSQDPEQDSIRVLLRWPALVSNKFVKLLLNQDHRCLIIIAHFIMLLLSLDFDKLYPRKMLREEISNIDSVVDESWRCWLDLPKRVLGLL